MADTHDPAERPGHQTPRRVLNRAETDRLLELGHAYADAVEAHEANLGNVHRTGTLEETRRGRRDAQDAFVRYVVGLSTLEALNEYAESTRQADGPRVDAPVEVVAECKAVGS